MAKALFFNFCISLLIIAILVSHEIIPTEARHLRTHRKSIKNSTLTVHEGAGGLRTGGGSVKTDISKEEHGVDEFRPTTPGNSPGIGH
ncbi:Precursor of CEP8 [Arabidopsis thaliana]|uniref:Precursor of CEP8 n=2 Tax=Arabidopsis thaliana TaxID=3702 RepID=PCEP8_ARATH|nr:RecName: Full=Precursor of CEP8; Short=PCEP8; Contains: RecName: Full=C-terminally encoded peptide 8; Short=CEP8; Flags: Precursor [Arabidopsis thaliana]OAO95904.1 hypothetical protein AXX17_AT5G66850 [Arabidopsis thaliana]